MTKDFRIIPLRKMYNDFYNEEVYIIPCKVLSIGRKLSKRIFEINLEILDFTKAKMVEVTGTTYKGSLDYFSETPFFTDCIVRRSGNGDFELSVYNVTNVGLIEKIFGVKKMLNDDEILNLFNFHYSKLLNWINEKKEVVEKNNYDDLPF